MTIAIIVITLLYLVGMKATMIGLALTDRINKRKPRAVWEVLLTATFWPFIVIWE